jgi:UDP:flavonoid glycosyltransferase YjiC (YdhE family)
MSPFDRRGAVRPVQDGTTGAKVMVLVGAGAGHYHPIAAFVSELVADPGSVVFVTDVPAGHRLRDRMAADGFRVMDLDTATRRRPVDRGLQAVRRRLVRHVAPRLATFSGTDAALPSLPSRTVFALASLLRPLKEARAERGTSLDGLLAALEPDLVLAESHDDWLEVLCARHRIPWARYTTGPVASLDPHRPIEPAGLTPELPGFERPVNAVLRTAGLARRRAAHRRVDRAGRRLFGATSRRGPVARFAFAARALDDHAAGPSHGWDYLGLSPHHAPDGWSAAPADEARDTVLVTWGTGRVGSEADLMGTLAPVLGELGTEQRVVVLSGNPDTARTLATCTPEGAEVIVRPPSDSPPYDEYRRARLVVAHGGYGTINESVAFGSPVLVIPELVADRMETARRVMHARVGRSINRYGATPHSIRTAVHDLLGDASPSGQLTSVSAELRDRGPRDEMLRRLTEAMEGR